MAERTLEFRRIDNGFGGGNFIADVIEEEYYVSYNPNTFDGSGPETALVNNTGDGKPAFLILNGDFREHYSKVYDGTRESLEAVYNANKSHFRSGWSMDF